MVSKEKQKLLLHCCCAPCATFPLQLLSQNYEIAGYFYNPNIYPEKEYKLRCREIEKLGQEWNIPILTGPYESRLWYRKIKGHEDEEEGGARCALCYQMRFEAIAREAVSRGFEVIASTLSISPHKKAMVINRIGKKVAEKAGLKFLEADFKKKDGFKISCEMSRDLGFYRQNYCGCEFSYLDSLKRGEKS